jgi:hypothetical protein
MEILVKIYDNYRSTIEKSNFFTKEQITISESLDSFDTATLKANWYGITEYNKIEIYEAGIPDVLVFRWLVHETNKTISILKDETIITCRSERNIISTRRAIAARTKIDTVENIVTELLWDYPSDSFTTGIWFDQVISISYKIGDQYSSIFDEIVLQCKWYWDIKDSVVLMDSMLGTDKTSGSSQISLAFTRTQGDNIKEINIIGQSTRANMVIWENSSTRHISQDLSSWIVWWVAKVKFFGWDLVEKTDNVLAKVKIRQRLLNISLDPNKIINAIVWDKLNLEISNVDSIEDISWVVLVTDRSIVYSRGRKKILLSVGTDVIKKDSLWEIILGIKKEVDLLE